MKKHSLIFLCYHTKFEIYIITLDNTRSIVFWEATIFVYMVLGWGVPFGGWGHKMERSKIEMGYKIVKPKKGNVT